MSNVLLILRRINDVHKKYQRPLYELIDWLYNSCDTWHSVIVETDDGEHINERDYSNNEIIQLFKNSLVTSFHVSIIQAVNVIRIHVYIDNVVYIIGGKYNRPIGTPFTDEKWYIDNLIHCYIPSDLISNTDREISVRFII